MRKLISILIIGIFVFNTVGYFTVFKIEQYYIRKEIKNELKKGVPKSELHEFVFSFFNYSSIDWVRKNKEFRMNGSMYDVVDIKIENDKIKYFCIEDKEEAKLFARLSKLVEDEMENHSGTNGINSRKLIKLANSLEFLFWDEQQSILFLYNEVFLFDLMKSHHSIIYLEVISPPPELV